MTTDSESFDQHFDDEKFLQEEETNNDLLDLTIVCFGKKNALILLLNLKIST